MAKNREPEPEASMDTEGEESGEEDETSSEENGSESEPETPQTASQTIKKPAIPPAKKPEPSLQAQAPAQLSSESSSEEEEESGSESDSDGPVRKPDPNIKPIASKPMDEPQKPANAPKKARSKVGPASPAKSGASAVAKRPAEESEVKQSKRSKKKLLELEPEKPEKKTNDDAKKQLFQRLWSEDDEIVILNGMIDYAAKKRADPVADLNAFHEFIKKSLHIDVTKTQLQDKIRRLKKKYENNASKEKKGKERTFSKAHEQKAYELSKKIWGSGKTSDANAIDKDVVETPKINGSLKKGQNDGASGSIMKVDGVKEEKRKVSTESKGEDEKGGSASGGGGKGVGGSTVLNFSVEDWILKSGSEYIVSQKRGEMDAKWRALKVEEIELFVKRTELVLEQSKLVLEGLKSGKF